MFHVDGVNNSFTLITLASSAMDMWKRNQLNTVCLYQMESKFILVNLF